MHMGNFAEVKVLFPSGYQNFAFQILNFRFSVTSLGLIAAGSQFLISNIHEHLPIGVFKFK